MHPPWVSILQRQHMVVLLVRKPGRSVSLNIADATAAEDSLDVDWNENAYKSAKQYLEISGFSYSGPIEQLSSSAGDQYTASQATHGAKKAGSC